MLELPYELVYWTQIATEGEMPDKLDALRRFVDEQVLVAKPQWDTLAKFVADAAVARGDPVIERERIELALERIKNGAVEVERYPNQSPCLKAVYELARTMEMPPIPTAPTSFRMTPARQRIESGKAARRARSKLLRRM